MADNVVLDAGAGGATIKTDDDGTAHWQYAKMAYGADNTQTRVTASTPLPVQISDGTDTALVDGSGNVNVILAANSGVDIGDVDITGMKSIISVLWLIV